LQRLFSRGLAKMFSKRQWTLIVLLALVLSL
jgi:hypothetical protein